MSVTLYNVTSSDGFIATRDSKEDFIPDSLWGEFLSICEENDVVVISRKTYEAIQNYNKSLINLFEDLSIKKLILTKDLNFKPKKGYEVAHSPSETLGFGENILVCGGSSLNDSFIKEGIIDTVVVNVLPIEIKDGIKQFEIQPQLLLISEKVFPQWVKRTYKVIK
jgi:dihydrofolate reductase